MREDQAVALLWTGFLLFLMVTCASCSLFIEGPRCKPNGTLLKQESCLYGDMQHESAWVEGVLDEMHLPDDGRLDIHLYSHGDMVTLSYPGPLPQGGCVNGYYDEDVLFAVPGSLVHELFHALSDQLGTAVPVYEVPSLTLWELYELQHTPAFGWREGYDFETAQIYGRLGFGGTDWAVCSGW